MQCRKCGVTLSPDDNFCEDCGASVKEAPPKTNSVSVVVNSCLASVSDIGKRHHENEDAGLVANCDNGDIILVVADGVSSSVNASSASELAVTVIKDVLLSNISLSPFDRVYSAISTANDKVLELTGVKKTDGIYGPETTVVAALVCNGVATIGWVGDSRAYLLGKESQELLTVDDSWAEVEIRSGRLTPEQAMADKYAHYVTQVLGMRDQSPDIHVIQCDILVGQKLLLCSDGLWNYFAAQDALLNAVNESPHEDTALALCEYLVEQSNKKGGHDNITIAVLYS